MHVFKEKSCKKTKNVGKVVYLDKFGSCLEIFGKNESFCKSFARIRAFFKSSVVASKKIIV